MCGSRLVRFLLDAGAKVTVFDNFSRGHTTIPGAEYIENPLVDAGIVTSCAKAFRDTYAVFNLAASVGGVYYNIKNHSDQFWSNLRLQAAPVFAAEMCHVPIFLQTSTVCVYGRGYSDPCVEENGRFDEPEPSNAGYGWAKRMGERICEWGFTDTKWVIVRPTNMFGLNDYYDQRAHVIPALIKKFESRQIAEVFGGPQIREFIFADDVARGMMHLAEHSKAGGIYNLGTDGETSVTIEDLAYLVRDAVGSGAEINFTQDRPTGIPVSRTDCTKARSLGWHYQVSLEEGLRMVLEERNR